MFKNTVVVITGGGSGIGRSIAKLFSENNAIVCITDKNLESAKKHPRSVSIKVYVIS